MTDYDEYPIPDPSLFDGVDTRKAYEQLKGILERGLKGFVGDHHVESTRESIKGVLTDFLKREIPKRFLDQVTIDARIDEKGMFVASIRGPKEFFRGPFGGFLAALTPWRDERYMTLKAKRTMLGSAPPTKMATEDKERDVEVVLTIEEKDDGIRVVKVTDGGVTGWENFILREDDVVAMCERGWVACAGTRGRWDRLYIPADQMRSFFDAYGILSEMGLR
jgi:hypothetical protein